MHGQRGEPWGEARTAGTNQQPTHVWCQAVLQRANAHPLHSPCSRWDAAASSYVPTKLGHATLASGMTPEDALTVRADLAKARHGFVLASDLHLTFLVTPVREELPMDWHRFYDIFGRLGSTDANIAELVGLSQKYLQVSWALGDVVVWCKTGRAVLKTCPAQGSCAHP